MRWAKNRACDGGYPPSREYVLVHLGGIVEFCTTHPLEEGNLLFLLRVMVLQPGTVEEQREEERNIRKRWRKREEGRDFFVA